MKSQFLSNPKRRLTTVADLHGLADSTDLNTIKTVPECNLVRETPVS